MSVMPWPTSTQEAQPGERSSAKLDRGSRSLRRIPGTPPTSRDSTGLGRGEAGEFYLRLRDVEATLSSTDPRPRVRAAQARPGPLLANRVARACASPDAGACWSGRRLRSSHFRLPLGWWPCRLIMCQFGRLSTKRGTRPAARWRSTVRYRQTASRPSARAADRWGVQCVVFESAFQGRPESASLLLCRHRWCNGRRRAWSGTQASTWLFGTHPCPAPPQFDGKLWGLGGCDSWGCRPLG